MHIIPSKSSWSQSHSHTSLEINVSDCNLSTVVHDIGIYTCIVLNEVPSFIILPSIILQTLRPTYCD
jgi:hypothetical protein